MPSCRRRQQLHGVSTIYFGPRPRRLYQWEIKMGVSIAGGARLNRVLGLTSFDNLHFLIFKKWMFLYRLQMLLLCIQLCNWHWLIMSWVSFMDTHFIHRTVSTCYRTLSDFIRAQKTLVVSKKNYICYIKKKSKSLPIDPQKYSTTKN